MASDMNWLASTIERSLNVLTEAHKDLASAVRDPVTYMPTSLENVWQDVFLASFKLFRDMDPTLSASEVRDLAIQDANCVVETLRQKDEDKSNDA